MMLLNHKAVRQHALRATWLIAGGVLSVAACAAVADQAATNDKSASDKAASDKPAIDKPASDKPASDKWVAPPAVSPGIEIPANVPGRAESAPSVSSVSDVAAAAEPAPTIGPETPRHYETLSRATDRRFSIVTFNNVRRGLGVIYGAMKRVVVPQPVPAGPLPSGSPLR